MERMTKTRGDEWSIRVEIENLDITGATFTAQSRPYANSDDVQNWTCTPDLGQTPPLVDCSLDATATALINDNHVLWDIQMTKDGAVTTLAKAKIFVEKDVTR